LTGVDHEQTEEAIWEEGAGVRGCRKTALLD
jgi:hypothetical protein